MKATCTLSITIILLMPLLSGTAAARVQDDMVTSGLVCDTSDVVRTICGETHASVHLDCFWATSTLAECTGYGDISYSLQVPPGLGGNYTWNFFAFSQYCEGSPSSNTCVIAVDDSPVPYPSGSEHFTWPASLNSQAFSGSRHFVFPTITMTETQVGDSLTRWEQTASQMDVFDTVSGEIHPHAETEPLLDTLAY
jgi:hypothetical protein